ncbi:MAG: prolyl oligopeptidase family serine peptidase [Bryobacteraceae bacterium]
MRLLVLLAALPLAAQNYDPPPSVSMSPAETSELREGLTKLRKKIASLNTADPHLIPDVEIYAKAVEWLLRHPEECFTKLYVDYARKAIETGLRRAGELENGKHSWTTAAGYVVRGYRSKVDGSVQPYAMLIPERLPMPARLDVWLHGRGATLTELSFIAQHDPSFPNAKPVEPIPAGRDYLQLDAFGRTNNAYRWSGETDVFEAIDEARQYQVDPRRIVLRGFSMGGAGTWHIGLHYPDRWAAIEAGAGFSETVRYAKKPDLPPDQRAMLSIYDAEPYALNAVLTATVGYGGEMDPQLTAAMNIREQLEREGVRFLREGFRYTTTDLKALFLIGPQTPHRWHPDSKRESEEFIRKAIVGRSGEPERIRFITHTTRYPGAFRVRIHQLEKQYERAEVIAARGEATTRNVRVIQFTGGHVGITIDGQRVDPAPYYLKHDGRWSGAAQLPAGLFKRQGLQGPIDDAFTDSFLCVRPTGKPWNEGVQRTALERLERFRKEFAKRLRGDVRIVSDRAVTDADMGRSNVILFGDPGSNRLLARMVKQLPVTWSRKEIAFGDRRFDAAANLPVLIYPNPLSLSKYVVVNSGHTFGEADFRGTNALLFPRIADYGVIRANDEQTVLSGFFDESWRLGR